MICGFHIYQHLISPVTAVTTFKVVNILTFLMYLTKSKYMTKDRFHECIWICIEQSLLLILLFYKYSSLVEGCVSNSDFVFQWITAVILLLCTELNRN